MKISTETQGFVSCLKSCFDLYEQVEDALVARYGDERMAADILAADDGFREKWRAVCEVVKGYLSDSVLENVACRNAEEI